MQATIWIETGGFEAYPTKTDTKTVKRGLQSWREECFEDCRGN